ncbi:hypothetical protein CERSUDRAFT_156239 [Gelatoporia subvermispora B]|uniref:Sucraseferredoxin-like protein n=1 Tax=Ceriporiopsis subvermispora (strain B) TaxID=914234 RepID=M2RDN0_CERS8|nr:hypothetical protein CERSUDRAFT_156239 [Gelatoporia subvermispora B]
MNSFSSLLRLQNRCTRFEKSRTSRRLLTTAAPQESLAGTVPYHLSYILLHTHEATSKYPSKFHSPLQRSLLLNVAQWGGVVNFSYSPEQRLHPGYTGIGVPALHEAYTATAFSVRGRLDLLDITANNMDDVAEALRALALGETGARAVHRPNDPLTLYLYVCTHGARDCRCGNTGGAVYEALRSEVEKRGLSERVFVGSVGHVGGHKYAANILVHPHGDWLGLVDVGDVPGVLDEILARNDALKEYRASLAPLCRKFWRGRMGLSKDEQLALLSSPP